MRLCSIALLNRILTSRDDEPGRTEMIRRSWAELMPLATWPW